MQRIPVDLKKIAEASLMPDFNEREYTESCLENHDPDSLCCQRCGKKIWSSGVVTSYKRFITWPCNGKPVTDEILIPLVLCEQCSESADGRGCENGDYCHAMLTDNLVPFTHFTLLFILTVLDEYFNRTRTVRKICANWGITPPTLYAWRNRYHRHYDLWADAIDSICRPESCESEGDAFPSSPPALAMTLSWVMDMLDELVKSFFLRFKFSFMQGCTRTHLREPAETCRPSF